MGESVFRFRKFEIRQDRCAMKIGTDGVLLGTWAAGGKRILDIGTGTGIVAMCMAQRFPLSNIVAVEVEKNAAKQAEENVRLSPFSRQISVCHSSFQSFYTHEEQHGSYDSIVSNPPYFTEDTRSKVEERHQARHTSSLSFSELCRGVALLLSEKGVFSVILPTDKVDTFVNEARQWHLEAASFCHVVTRLGKEPKRSLITFGKDKVTSVVSETAVLTNEDGSRSDWYVALTQDFYLW